MVAGDGFVWRGDVEAELFHLAGDQHHVRAERVHQLAGGVGVEADAARLGLGGDPTDRIGLSHAGQLDQAAGVAQRLADSLVALFVLIVHAAQVGRDAQVVGDEEQHGLRVGAAEVGIDGGKFGLPGTAAVEQLEVAHEEDLEGSHQRWRLRAVEDLEDGGVGEVEVVQREVARGLRS